MKVAVIGSGGREHAIVNQLLKSKYVTKVCALPGNAGIGEVAELVDIKASEIDRIVAYTKVNRFDLVFVAPDDPLAMGLVDRLNETDIRVFGPTRAAAQIEWSKAFAKGFMERHGIPTADYKIFNGFDAAYDYLQTAKYPLVVKADGLALGKGVIICKNKAEAQTALTGIMVEKVFSSAGDSIVIEEFLTGPEITLLVFTDGKSYSFMPSSQDHKRAYDGNEGPNTGGMGAFSPASAFADELKREAASKIIEPTLKGLIAENRTFKGVLYFGLMNTKDGLKVIEYNARFGDPEAQTVLPLLKTDFIDVIDACIDGSLDQLKMIWDNKASVCVVAASGGYPVNVVKGYPIEIGKLDGVTLIHCGTAIKDGQLVTNGGRVFCVTAIADTVKEAAIKIYREIDKIKFEGMRYRNDIGIRHSIYRG